MSFVFISYKREDLDRVMVIHRALKAAGLEVWMDLENETGEKYRPEIRKKLEAASCVIVCWSKLSIVADFVLDEADIAKQRHTLLQVRIEPVSLPLGFGQDQAPFQWPPDPNKLADLVQAARKKLEPRPTLFVASTAHDLSTYREQARSAAHALGFAATFSEDVDADQSLTNANIVFVIVAYRYSAHVRHVYETARRLAKPLILFLPEPDYPWLEKLKEKHRALEVLNASDPAAFTATLQHDIAQLEAFKTVLARQNPIHFTDPHSLRAAAVQVLQEWAAKQATNPVQGAADHELYLKYLEDDTRQIRIRALKTKRAEPYFFGIDEIYIALTTTSTAGEGHRGPGVEMRERRTALEHALNQRKLVITGDPGAGKSTFLRRVAFELCRNLRNTRPAGTEPFLNSDDRRFPILIRVGDLAKLLASEKSAKPADSPDWIPFFLHHQSREFKWRLDYEFFERKLSHEGNCLLLIDGLDEAPDRRMRERIARIFEKATAAFAKCDSLVTTRPQSYDGASVLAGFHTLRIGELEPQETRIFLSHFAKALALNEVESEKFQRELGDALEHRAEIREMAANPVMLTALAVLQHNDQRLPEHRVQLYESIVEWLAAAREHKDGRPDASRCLEVMRRLALHMQDAPDGERLVQINRRKAAEFIHREFGGGVDACEALLEQEVEDSGILAPVGADLKFWHLSFQEYLAAREIASLADDKQSERVLTGGKLYRPEWRETMRLLGAVLRVQGEAKIEGLVEAILGSLPPNPTLPQKAPRVALLGAMMRDLLPMGYQPRTPGYERIVRDVMSIFEPGDSQKIDLKLRIEAADALGQVGDPRLEEETWVTIPAGEFWMGAQKKSPRGRNYDKQADSREAPVHRVSLPAFRIRRFPVTVQEYAEFINASGYSHDKHWTAGGFGQFQGPDGWEKQRRFPNRPVVSVSWFEAAAYCAWRGERLPTEAEWERAARGPQGSRFPWGNEPALNPAYANYGEKGPGHPTPVGLYPLGNGADGLSDMLGNVWEWTADWYQSYSARSPQKQEYKVLRGGSWDYSPGSVRVSYRVGGEPEYRGNNIGFRCAGEFP